MNLTKYVRFTEWYDCDLLVLADTAKSRKYNCDLRILARDKDGLSRTKKEKYFLVLRCITCDTYDWFPCDELPTTRYIIRQNCPSSQYIKRQNVPSSLARGFPFGYRMAEGGTFWLRVEEEPPPLTILSTSAISEKQQTEYWDLQLRIWKAAVSTMPYKSHPSLCHGKPFERIVVPNYFLIQAATLGRGRVVLGSHP
ncbi:MAG: hypothetical protein ABSB35_30900 [Bryobacteraceae bacterium]